MFSYRTYDSSVAPKRGAEANWYVWNMEGALRVLQSHEYQAWLTEHLGERYDIIFANNSCAKIADEPTSQLWQEMCKIVEKGYVIMVFPLRGEGEAYVLWSPEDGPRGFEAISIACPAESHIKPPVP